MLGSDIELARETVLFGGDLDLDSLDALLLVQSIEKDFGRHYKPLLCRTHPVYFTPLFHQNILLAWLGTGDERTDIVAHLTGFITGFGLGILLGRLPKRPGADVSRQWISGCGALLGLFFAWSIALGG